MPSNVLLQVIDALYAFEEQHLGNRPGAPLYRRELEAFRSDTERDPAALAAWMQAHGLGWVCAGPIMPPVPVPPGPTPPPTPGPVPVPAPVGARRQIAVVNQSTTVSAADFAACCAALQVQVDRDFAPAWGGLGCQLVPAQGQPGTPQAPAGETIYVLDDSDQAGALGYHELTQAGVPVGFCFAKTTLDAHLPWQPTLSHELLEQLADPYVQTAVVAQSFQGKPAAIAYETGDPVEADSYDIDGVPVSNFVLPAWFEDNPVPSGRYDFLQKLTAPLTLTAGGYVAYTTDLRNWAQYMPQGVRAHREAVLPFSRKWKRFWRGEKKQ